MRLLLVALASLAYLSQIPQAVADFRLDLARRLNISDPRWLIINLPPRPSCHPGTVFSSDYRFNILPNTAKTGFERGPEFSFISIIDVEGSAGGSISGLALPFQIAAEAKGFASASLEINRAHVLEIAAPGIRNVLKKLPKKLRNTSPPPAMVQRAYEGYFLLTLARKTEADTTAMTRLYNKLVSAGVEAKFSEDRLITFASKEPVVFAFEVAQLNDLNRIASTADILDGVRNAGGGAGSGTTGTSAVVVQKGSIPNASPGLTIGDQNTVATGSMGSVGAAEVEELVNDLPSGALTGLRRVEADSFERENPAPSFTVR